MDGMSQRAISQELGYARNTVAKAIANPIPPGYRLSKPRSKPAIDPVTYIDAWLEQGTILSRQAAKVLRTAIAARQNIIIAGGTGSGKTTLINACLAEPAITRDRVVIIEDTRELQCNADDCVRLIAPPALQHVTTDDLVRTTLRLCPDRIVIGEVRGGEALSMIKAWSTGHPGGLCSVHANGPHDALYRLEELMREVTVTVPRRSIATAVGLVVFIERGAFGDAQPPLFAGVPRELGILTVITTLVLTLGLHLWLLGLGLHGLSVALSRHDAHWIAVFRRHLKQPTYLDW